MTKEAFIQKHIDELVGMLLMAFGSEENTRGIAEVNVANRGKFMMDTMKRAKSILGRMHDDLVPRPEPPKGKP